MARDRDENFTGNGREDGDDAPDDTDTPAPTRRTRDGDDSDDTPRPGRRRPAYENDEQPKRGFPVWGWVLVAVGGVGLLGLLAFGALTLVGVLFLANRPPVPPPIQVAPAKKTYTRDEFRTLVMGKTEAEVLQAVGKPDRTVDHGSVGTKDWFFPELTTDPITGKIDRTAFVHIAASGRVDEVSY